MDKKSVLPSFMNGISVFWASPGQQPVVLNQNRNQRLALALALAHSFAYTL